MQLRGNLKEEERKHQTMLVPDVQRDNYSINVFIRANKMVQWVKLPWYKAW